MKNKNLKKVQVKTKSKRAILRKPLVFIIVLTLLLSTLGITAFASNAPWFITNVDRNTEMNSIPRENEIPY